MIMMHAHITPDGQECTTGCNKDPCRFTTCQANEMCATAADCFGATCTCNCCDYRRALGEYANVSMAIYADDVATTPEPEGRRAQADDDDAPWSRFPGDARDSRLLPNVQQILIANFDNDPAGKPDMFLHAPALSPGSCAQQCHSLGRFGARQPHLYTPLGPMDHPTRSGLLSRCASFAQATTASRCTTAATRRTTRRRTWTSTATATAGRTTTRWSRRTRRRRRPSRRPRPSIRPRSRPCNRPACRRPRRPSRESNSEFEP
jgi:hypothetical protein